MSNTTKINVTQAQALDLWRRGNDAGRGYAPYTDDVVDDSIDSAVEAAEADGWEVVYSRETDDQIVVLANADGDLLGIGGDAAGNGAWAVALRDEEV